MKEENLIQNEAKKKSIYRELFLKINESILDIFNDEKQRLNCNSCSIYSKECPHNPKSPTQKLPKECIYRFWQENCITTIETKIDKNIYEKITEINSLKEKYTCQRCAACCRMASSEYSYDELKQRAENGDIFSKQFVSIFVPYKNKEDTRQFYPEFFDLLESKYKGDEKIYFYYCPKLGSDNLCTDYKNRPDICRDFPNNPLVIFPKGCGFRKWQDEVDILALAMHAMVEITDFYKTKISEALKD